MRVAVLQPSYLPWLGYLDQIARCDAFVFYDDVQYDKNGWRNRNRIRVPGGEGWAWLTIPVRLPASFPSLLTVEADARVPWRRKHRAAIAAAYGRAPYFPLFEATFAELLAGDERRLVEIAIQSVRSFTRALNIRTPCYRSSELKTTGDRNERLFNICKLLGATRYLSGAAARSYLDVAGFEAVGITVEWQDYAHPVYRQRYEPFVSHLSALDALLNVGPDTAAFLGQPESALSGPNPSDRLI